MVELPRMNGVEIRGLRRAAVCLALLASGTAYAQSNVPAPRDVTSPSPTAEAPARMSPIKPADANKAPSAAAVPSPSQLLAPPQEAAAPEKNGSAPAASAGAAAVPATPPNQPAQKAEAKPKK